MSNYYVYMIANASGMLYIGVTNNLERRVWEHKSGQNPGFTKKYNLKKLVYYETSPSHIAAIEREKQLKKWRHEKKVKLLETMNPKWLDLSDGWYPDQLEEKE